VRSAWIDIDDRLLRLSNLSDQFETFRSEPVAPLTDSDPRRPSRLLTSPYNLLTLLLSSFSIAIGSSAAQSGRIKANSGCFDGEIGLGGDADPLSSARVPAKIAVELSHRFWKPLRWSISHPKDKFVAQ
jgi:hypothetical protein